MSYAKFHEHSIVQRDAFWREQSDLVDWHVPPQEICDYSHPPFANWFKGGQTNLCFNAVDRHLKDRANQSALICVSSETGQEKAYSFQELSRAVQQTAQMMRHLGVGQGDRVLIYMPMVAEAVFAMLACVRIGAIHSVVFGGFAAHSLATRIEDASPQLIVSADAGSRGGKVVAYKPLLDEAIDRSSHKPQAVLMVNRGLVEFSMVPGRDHAYEALKEQFSDAQVPCVWVDATHPSYTLYTSGTTGKPKGVQRDTGGYAVALAASMKHIFMGSPGGTYFCTSDIGWVVGHSYIVYGPLIAGMATILYEGLPIRPDAGIWWQLVEKYKVTSMFSAPTAIRVLKKQDPKYLSQYDLSSLKALFLAGEPLDEPTAKWISEGLGKPVIDNYWQTETGWPILTLAKSIEDLPTRLGSPGLAVYGYDVQLIDDVTSQEIIGPHQKGVLTIKGPLPPGCLQTIWGDDERFVKTYWQTIPGRMVYSTFDWAVRDESGYYFILGRTDDVINVAGHRLGTREIEECLSSHASVAEVAVVGVSDALKGQVAMAFVVLKNPSLTPDDASKLVLEGDIMKLVDQQLGAIARPARVFFVNALPKTRSGKLLRRVIQAVCEGRDTGDLTTIEDPSTLEPIKAFFKT